MIYLSNIINKNVYVLIQVNFFLAYLLTCYFKCKEFLMLKKLVKWIFHLSTLSSLCKQKKRYIWYIHDISTNILVVRPPNAYGPYYTVWERWKVWSLYCPYNAKILHRIDVLGTSVIWTFLYKYWFSFQVDIEEMSFCSFMGTFHAKTDLIRVFVSETWSIFANSFYSLPLCA